MGLTKGQLNALAEVRKGRNVFITGGGGVGKSYTIRKIVAELQESGKTVLITASTGKAATLVGGVTCHRAFHIPIKAAWLAEPNPTNDSPLYQADVILIDEVSMLRLDAFEYIVRSVEKVNALRESGNDPDNTHLDPIQMIVVGDFCQLPPVIVHPDDGSPDEGDMMSDHFGFNIGHGYAFLAPGWERSNFVTCELKEVMRQSDKSMINALNGVRFNNFSSLSYFKTHTRKRKFSVNDGDVVYLCGKNRTADRINKAALSRLPGKEFQYYAECTGQVSEQDKLVPDLIRLKNGAHVIMVQNSEKYRNGSSGTITATYESSVSVLIHETGEEVDVPYATWDIERYVVKEKNGNKKVEKEKIGSYSQLPLRLGYAITIHKSQGQTYGKVVLVLGSDDKKKGARSTRPEIFAYGQLYVALSRVNSIDGLYIEGNLDLVDKLTAPEVMNFYGVSKIHKTKTGADSVTDKSKKQPKQKALKKAAVKKEISEMEKKNSASGLAVIHCSNKNVSIAWIFAHALSPDAVLSGTDIQIPEKYRDQTEMFINTL